MQGCRLGLVLVARDEEVAKCLPETMGVVERRRSRPWTLDRGASKPACARRIDHSGAFRPLQQPAVIDQPLGLETAIGPVDGIHQIEGGIAPYIKECGLDSGGLGHA